MKTVKIDGKEYSLDFEEALKTGLLKGRLAIGDRFRHKDGEIYILAEIQERDGARFATLINNKTGKQYSSIWACIHLQPSNDLPESVFKSLTGPFSNSFTPVP